ncbi:MAG: S53 family peptidase [Solirubrobacteraceae bacterium]
MTIRMRHTAALGLAAIAAGLLLPGTSAARAETVSPLPGADYAVRPACRPPSEGRATCLALQLVPTSAAARARNHPLGVTLNHTLPASSAKEGAYGLTPAELHSAYEIPTTSTGAQTIALVDAYNDPNAAADLKAYEAEFGLKGCEEAACFTKVNEDGETAESSLPFPHSDHELETALKSASEAQAEQAEAAEGWDVEISLDIEAARATCENCHILLVEASSPEEEDLGRAEDWAAEQGAAQEISNSWGGPEGESPTPFDHPGTVITASAGDQGYRSWNAAEEYEREYTSFPASSPDVVAVGGTRLLRAGGKWQSETVWNDGGESDGFMDGYGATGGGCSELFTAQPWQQHVADWSEVGCGSKRAVADVAADGDPYTGFALYDTNPAPEKNPKHWYTYGGTSLSSPIIASTFALAGGSGGVAYPAETLYENETRAPASLHDILASSTSGSNGRCSLPFDEETSLTGCEPEEEAHASCSARLICIAHSGYDGPSGVGSPDGLQAFEPLSAEQTAELTRAQEEAEAALRSEEQARAAEEAARAREEAREREAPGTGTQTQPGVSGGGSLGVVKGESTTTTGAAASASPRISALALTLKALLALNRAHPRLSRIAFAFSINVSARVEVTLARRVRRHGHTRWMLVRRAPAISATPGRDVRGLRGSGVLAPGAYRLTLTPTGGAARSLSFDIG